MKCNTSFLTFNTQDTYYIKKKTFQNPRIVDVIILLLTIVFASLLVEVVAQFEGAQNSYLKHKMLY